MKAPKKQDTPGPGPRAALLLTRRNHANRPCEPPRTFGLELPLRAAGSSLLPTPVCAERCKPSPARRRQAAAARGAPACRALHAPRQRRAACRAPKLQPHLPLRTSALLRVREVARNAAVRVFVCVCVCVAWERVVVVVVRDKVACATLPQAKLCLIEQAQPGVRVWYVLFVCSASVWHWRASAPTQWEVRCSSWRLMQQGQRHCVGKPASTQAQAKHTPVQRPDCMLVHHCRWWHHGPSHKRLPWLLPGLCSHTRPRAAARVVQGHGRRARARARRQPRVPHACMQLIIPAHPTPTV